MAASTADQPTTATQSTPHHAAGAGSRPQSSSHDAPPAASLPVEMETLQPPAPTPAPAPAPAAPATATTAPAPASTSASTPTTAHVSGPSDAAPAAASTPHVADATPSEPAQLAAPAPLNRAESEAIGPSTDVPTAIPETADGPVVVITLLLTTGARHPWRVDAKYLAKRNVTVDENDPFNITVYQLKELIWRDWRQEWEARPTAPSSIRLIHFGRMLEDTSPLKDCRFQRDTPNVVHMTIRPQSMIDDVANAKGGNGANQAGDEEERTHGCRCVIL